MNGRRSNKCISEVVDNAFESRQKDVCSKH
jgi:hypothetical protein